MKKSDIFRVATLKGPSSMAMAHLPDCLERRGGVCVDISSFDEPVKLRAQLMAGDVDFAVLPTTMSALLYNNGIDYRIAAVIVWGSLFLCGNDVEVRTFRDLKGRRVSLMAAGTPPDLTFRHLMKRNGLSPEDVALDYSFSGHTGLADAAGDGLTDFCVLAEPYISQVTARNKAMLPLLDLSLEWNRVEGMMPAETAFLCRGDLAVKFPSAVVEMVKALKESACEELRAPEGGVDADHLHFDVASGEDAGERIFSYLKIFHEEFPAAIGGRLPDGDFVL